MRIGKKQTEQIALLIAGALSGNTQLTREQLMERVCDGFSLTTRQRADHTGTSVYTALCTYTAKVLREMTECGSVSLHDGKYRLCREQPIAVQRQQCREQILAVLRRGACEKNRLYRTLENHFGTDRTLTEQDDNALRSLAGQVLSDLERKGIVNCKEGVCSCSVPGLMPLHAAGESGVIYPTQSAIQDALFARLHTLGGGFFEDFCAGVLEKYFLVTGRQVVFCEGIGGSDDGGIDIRIGVKDDLGFFENIAVQTKCRENIHTTEKEIREFYGAMNAIGATRGIFITAAAFHPGAEKFLTSLPDCVGVDGKKLFSLICITGYGIRACPGGYTFDEIVFS